MGFWVGANEITPAHAQILRLVRADLTNILPEYCLRPPEALTKILVAQPYQTIGQVFERHAHLVKAEVSQPPGTCCVFAEIEFNMPPEKGEVREREIGRLFEDPPVNDAGSEFINLEGEGGCWEVE